MTTIYIESTTGNEASPVTVYFAEPGDHAPQYVLATFPINTPFTRRMAATVAAEYSDTTGIPIDDATLSLSLRNHLRRVERERPDLRITHRIKLGEPVAAAGD